MRYTLPILENAHEIATKKYPLRASALPKINECPASVFLSQAFWLPGSEDEAGGEAAQMGNLVHAAADAYHRLVVEGNKNATVDERTEAGLAAMQAAREKFPGGDFKKATKVFRAYADDPENAEAEVLKLETVLTCELPPSPLDPTGQPVYIRGHVDQVRLVGGVPKVFDIKTGRKFYGITALDHYMTQQAAYTLAAQQTYGEDFKGRGLPEVEPGALICTDGYFRANGRVQWHHKWGTEDIPLILQNVVNQVAAARAKLLSFAPSTDACVWCEHKKFANCKAFYQEHVS